MVIVKIIGGLGNQLFQYAYAKSLQLKGYDVKIDISAFNEYKLHGGYQLDKYKISLISSKDYENKQFYSRKLFSKILYKLNLKRKNIHKESNLLFDSSLLQIRDNTYMEGYFQSEKYFNNIRNVLLEECTIKAKLSDYALKIKQDIESFNNSCSIHVRRGDFTNKDNKNIHGSCSLEYYRNAIDYMEKKYNNMKYYIFSDDISWCKENLKIKNIEYIDCVENRIPHEDIYLMSLCKHNIIANSSFSWWGAWLNKNKDKIVISPKRWFTSNYLQEQSKDIMCESWIKL